MNGTLTIEDVHTDAAAANLAFLAGAPLVVPYADAFAEWERLQGIDLSAGRKADLRFAAEQLRAGGPPVTVPLERFAGLRPERRPVVDAADPGAAFAVELTVGVAVAIAVAAVAIGFGVGFANGYLNGDQKDGGIEVTNSNSGTVTVHADRK